MTFSVSEIAELIGDAQVDKRVYIDQEIFDLEMERIFKRAWLYIGHES